MWALRKKTLLVRPMAPPTQTEGGIALPNSVTESDREPMGVVVRIGPDVIACEPGHQVIHGPFDGFPIRLNGIEYLVLQEDQILAVWVDATKPEKEETKNYATGDKTGGPNGRRVGVLTLSK